MTRDSLRLARDESERHVAVLAAELRALFDAARSSNADDEHDPEGATIAFERAQLSALLDAAHRRLTDAEAALRRFDDGTYGVCERCGSEIPSARLEARPSARTCVGCAA